jgi:hypothetical protein
MDPKLLFPEQATDTSKEFFHRITHAEQPWGKRPRQVPKKSEKTSLPSGVRKSEMLKNRVGRQTSTLDLVQVNHNQFVQVPLTFLRAMIFYRLLGANQFKFQQISLIKPNNGKPMFSCRPKTSWNRPRPFTSRLEAGYHHYKRC